MAAAENPADGESIAAETFCVVGHPGKSEQQTKTDNGVLNTLHTAAVWGKIDQKCTPGVQDQPKRTQMIMIGRRKRSIAA